MKACCWSDRGLVSRGLSVERIVALERTAVARDEVGTMAGIKGSAARTMDGTNASVRGPQSGDHPLPLFVQDGGRANCRTA